ncbi:MAG: hypothetical protein LBV69_08915 [Bacteroidales bacterium]|nr:hypothetical protein [Bacteroidales bacterium]
MKIIKFILAIILSVLMYGCHKNFQSYISTTTKSYCLFNSDSFWVYQDSATLKIDSVVLYNIIKEIKTNDNIDKENYKLSFKNYLKDTILYTESTINSDFVDNRENQNYYFHNFVDIYLKTYFCKCFGYRYINNILSFFDGKFYENYKLGETNFENVIITTNNIDEKNIMIKTYWAENVGIIRYEINNNVYKLINYKVNQ